MPDLDFNHVLSIFEHIVESMKPYTAIPTFQFTKRGPGKVKPGILVNAQVHVPERPSFGIQIFFDVEWIHEHGDRCAGMVVEQLTDACERVVEFKRTRKA
jgi:hypothetical protein